MVGVVGGCVSMCGVCVHVSAYVSVCGVWVMCVSVSICVVCVGGLCVGTCVRVLRGGCVFLLFLSSTLSSYIVKILNKVEIVGREDASQ